jgi:hypothetical protein
MVAADGRVLSANKRFFELWRVPPELALPGRMTCCWRMYLTNCPIPTDFWPA